MRLINPPAPTYSDPRCDLAFDLPKCYKSQMGNDGDNIQYYTQLDFVHAIG